MRTKWSWCTLKILVLSDSHSSLRFMRECVEFHCPDHVIHLGDHYDDAQAMSELYPHLRFHMVPGNCDCFRCLGNEPLVLSYDIGGVRFFMSHGHLQSVKMGDAGFVAQARSFGALVALYGHTHRATCYQTDDGIWVMNPGTCGSYGGSVGLIEIQNNKITSCRIWRQEDGITQ